MSNNTPTESEDQIKLAQYLDILERQWKVLWWTASANWQFQKSMAVKMKMKREWVRAGMCDLFIVFKKNIVFIELKREKWWKLTDKQKIVIEKINIVWDLWKWIVSAYVCFGYNEAKQIIDRYI